MCPAPMYIRGGEYLGEYSNNEGIAPLTGSEDFGLDFYEPEFFLDPVTWNSAGTYEIALKFDVDDFTGELIHNAPCIACHDYLSFSSHGF
jgi:hypothetical protein